MSYSSVRRVLTGHDQAGRAIVSEDAQLPVEMIPTGGAAFSVLWSTQSVPADNDDPRDARENVAALSFDAGTVLRIVDMVPGGESPMHRTNSVDYGIVISGAVELVLDDGSVTLLGPGDVVVQRGTIHAWRNPSQDVVSRIAFILVGAKPVTVDGAPLAAVDP